MMYGLRYKHIRIKDQQFHLKIDIINTGSYLQEDDIVRIDDMNGRENT